MASKVCTANGLRNIAKYAVVAKRNMYGFVNDTKKTSRLYDMLHYAARVLERIEELRADPYGISEDDYKYIIGGVRK